MKLAAPLLMIPLVLWTTACAPQTKSPSVTTTSEGQTTEAPAGTTAAQRNTALVRFVNADPGSKGLDLVLEGKHLATGVAYKSISPYVETPRGVARFKLRATDGTTDLVTNQRELFPGRHYTVLSLPRKKTEDARLVSLSDNLGFLDPGEARVRLINATTNVNDLDLFLAGTTNRILHGVSAASATSVLDMEAGAVEIQVPGRPAPPQFMNLKVEVGRLYTFIVVGTSSSLDVVQIVDRIGP